MKGSVKLTSNNLNFIKTSIPTVYALHSLDPEIDLHKNHKEMKILFGNQFTKYVPPSDFKHQLPSNGIAEFAFIGIISIILLFYSNIQ